MRRALQARMAEAEEEVRTLHRRAAEVEIIIEHTQAALSQSGGLTHRQPQPVDTAPPATSPAPEPQTELPAMPLRSERPPLRADIKPMSLRFRDLTATQAATIVLREAGGPLHVNAIFNKLLEDGFEFRGDHPTISLAVALNRSKRFRKVAPATFDLVMRDVPVQRASGS